MIEKVKNAISMYDMFSNGDSIYVGLSGGADSVSLLLILNDLKDIYNINVHAMHINHQLRGEESLRDENFCIELCKRFDIRLCIERIDVKSYCKEHRTSLEEGARILRYKCFQKLANGKIATAHTLSDNCETILHNLTRGTGLKGLTGIPPVRDNVIRPLIFCTRQEIEDFLLAKGVNFVTDSSNLSNDYTRNKIRHNVVPILKEINPQFEKKVLDTVEILNEDGSYIDSIANEVFESNVSNDGKTLNVDLRKYHNAIKHRCITRLFKENGLTYSHERILAIDNIIANDGKINVSNDVYFISKLGIISVVSISKECTNYVPMSTDLHINGKTDIFNKTVETTLIKNSAFINKKLTNYILDYDKIQGKALLRGRQFGDKIKLENRGFTSSVKKLLNENVPKNCRDTLCFICDDVDLIFMERFGVSQRVACDENTENYLVIRIVEKNQNNRELPYIKDID